MKNEELKTETEMEGKWNVCRALRDGKRMIETTDLAG